MEEADEKGDMKTVHQGTRALAGKSKTFNSKQPTKKKNGDLIQSEEEMGDLWQEFLSGKFSATELEAARQEYEPIGQACDDTDTLTYAEFEKAVNRMKKGKATGPDGIPAEVWKNSALANSELYFLLKNIWEHECVPKSLVLCAFVMIHKKDSPEDCANYRAIGLLNHSYKIMSVCILHRLIDETDWFLSDWQAGFRGQRGCRDNLLLLRVIYDQIINGNEKCVITFIDFAAAFDSISHKFLDQALGTAGAKRKTRALFRAIYAAAEGAVRLASDDGKISLSKTFNVERGGHH